MIKITLSKYIMVCWYVDSVQDHTAVSFEFYKGRENFGSIKRFCIYNNVEYDIKVGKTRMSNDILYVLVVKSSDYSKRLHSFVASTFLDNPEMDSHYRNYMQLTPDVSNLMNGSNFKTSFDIYKDKLKRTVSHSVDMKPFQKHQQKMESERYTRDKLTEDIRSMGKKLVVSLRNFVDPLI